MLGSISPVGEASRGQRWWLTSTAYTVASIAGGAMAGLTLGGAGAGIALFVAVPAWGQLMLLAIVALLASAVDARLVPWRVPSWRRQVDERWLETYRGWVYGGGFGFQLGAGVLTIVSGAVTYAAFAAAALTFSWQAGMLIGAVFGAARSLPLLLTARLRSASALYTVTQRVEAAEPLAARVTAAGELGVAAAALALAVLGGLAGSQAGPVG